MSDMPEKGWARGPADLPKPDGWLFMPEHFDATNMHLKENCDAGWSAEQVRAAILAERERCARVCENMPGSAWENEEGQLHESESDASACAAAIRRGSV